MFEKGKIFLCWDKSLFTILEEDGDDLKIFNISAFRDHTVKAPEITHDRIAKKQLEKAIVKGRIKPFGSLPSNWYGTWWLDKGWNIQE